MLTALFIFGEGVDYGSGQYNVTIPAGSVNASFDIAITDDGIFEQIEDFHLTIDQLSSLSGVIIGNPDRAVVNIFDNDRKWIKMCLDTDMIYHSIYCIVMAQNFHGFCK